MLLTTVLATLASLVAIARTTSLLSNVISQKLLTGRPALVLDMDDALYRASSGLSQSVFAAIVSYVQEITGCAPEEAKVLTGKFYREYGLTICGLVKEHGASIDGYEKFLNEHINYSTLSEDGSLRAILEAANADIVIFTNSARIHTERTLDLLGIKDIPHQIIFSDYYADEIIVKPNPRAFEVVEQLLGVPSNKIYFADDSLANIEMALTRGWNAVRINEKLQDDAVVPSGGEEEPFPSIRTIHDISSVFPGLFDESFVSPSRVPSEK